LRLLRCFFINMIFLLFLGVVGSLWTAVACCFQSDSKRLVAYSSIAHINFILAGLFSFFVKTKTFSILVIIIHGYVSAALFFFYW
jgi:NADH-quinone oxidoreductase subunit M